MSRTYVIVDSPYQGLIGKEVRLLDGPFPNWESDELEVAVSPIGTNNIIKIKRNCLRKVAKADSRSKVNGIVIPRAYHGSRGWRNGRAKGGRKQR